ncbi:hypothetical protein OG2516_18385 [Oceanicola granulosus HTCC2516]|uniref:Antitoxin Xre/MbcA/ParS-like toxin-binding domain-containing protein n=1 Tax=Oceanicola granulosus (strain ATCC BAA-861 / DSM 15982 / KCTC 12143 / HTCC2516) TaxID=314256 RepID=Q2CHH9_OCEGH|nr:antitoxin Xre/MbcA/ParS toxin-binding domain-containing protein [Oceanicola granulosus]EAR52060.1 hypothetical protein OG2516_18385 [Oceanicola granulosus HTCC2516]
MAQPSPLPDAARIAGVLGLPPSVADQVQLAGRVAAGLPAGSAERLRRALRPETFFRIIPEATYRRVRRQDRAMSRETSEKLYEFARLYARLSRIYGGDEARIARFLETPHAMLGGETPLALATSSSAGADAVLALLDAADAGFAA